METVDNGLRAEVDLAKRMGRGMPACGAKAEVDATQTAPRVTANADREKGIVLHTKLKRGRCGGGLSA